MTEHHHDWQDTGLPTESGGRLMECFCGSRAALVECPDPGRLHDLLGIEREWLAIGAALGPFWNALESMPASQAAAILVDAYGDVRAALAELIALKDGPRDENYERRKPLAWDAARDALSRSTPPLPEPGDVFGILTGYEVDDA